jgi:hypothetical protein
MNQGAKRQPEDENSNWSEEENSDDNEVCWAHELQKERKLVTEHKYQQLNKYPQFNNSASTDDFWFTALTHRFDEWSEWNRLRGNPTWKKKVRDPS